MSDRAKSLLEYTDWTDSGLELNVPAELKPWRDKTQMDEL